MPTLPFTPDADLAAEIVSQNVAYHEAQARLYDLSHPELTHAYQRYLLRHDLALIREHLRGVERPLAADIGAGTGRLALAFAAQGWDVLALDNSPAMLQVLQQRYLALRDPKGKLETIVAGADEFTPALLKGRPLHLVGFSSVLHHLPDYLAVVRHVAEALAPGGLLYITHDPLPAQVQGKTPAMRAVGVLDQVLRVPQQLKKQWVRHSLGPMAAPAEQSLVDFHDKAGLDVEAISAQLERAGVEVILLRPYKDRKTALVAYLDTHLFRTPNWRFRMIARKSA